jgi:hypothetical protein
MPKVNVPIIFFGTPFFSARVDGRYISLDKIYYVHARARYIFLSYDSQA